MSLDYWLDPFGEVCKVIKSWKPKGCKTEKEFEKSLLRKLQKELKGKKIQAQYGSGRQRIDIVVDDKVPIEVKKDIKDTSALQRLIGQMEQYFKKWEGLVLVICGNIEQDHLKELKEYAKKWEWSFDEGLIIIVK